MYLFLEVLETLGVRFCHRGTGTLVIGEVQAFGVTQPVKGLTKPFGNMEALFSQSGTSSSTRTVAQILATKVNHKPPFARLDAGGLIMR